ncbi:protein-ADP-ribose hydrolase, partial [Streptococcus dysgalactiae]
MPKSFELLGEMIAQLQAEEWVGDSKVSALPATLEGREILWRSLVNQRPPFPFSQHSLLLVNAYLLAWPASFYPLTLPTIF